MKLTPGTKIGRIELIDRGDGHDEWRVRCDCGRDLVMLGSNIKRPTNRPKSCGCAGKHGKSRNALSGGHPLYGVWQSMIQRCTDPGMRFYRLYGGRGIRVCERWRESFEAFLADVGERPPGKTGSGRALYSIDRIDPDGNYEPGNVRWATAAEQSHNRRDIKLSTAAVASIRERLAAGATHSSIARDIGVRRETISKIARHERWKEPACAPSSSAC